MMNWRRKSLLLGPINILVSDRFAFGFHVRELQLVFCMNFAGTISCGEEELKYAGGYCVPKNSMCDGKMQCTNGVDELCGKFY